MSYWDDLKALMQTHGKAAVSAALGNSPLGDIINNAPDLFNEAATSPTGQAVANGLTGAPLTNLVPNPGNPVDGAAQGLIAPSAEDAATPPVAASAGTAPTPTPSTPVSAPPSPESDDSDDSGADSEPSAEPAKSPSDLASILSTPNNDNEARKSNDAALEKRKKWNILPEALANAADAVAGSASAFGANVSQGHGAAQKATDDADIDQQGKDFEQGLSNDPNSDLSKQYQGLLARFLQKDPSDPMVTSRSAAQIAGQIPAIEKLASMQNQKDLKDIQLKGLQQQKQAADDMKKSNEQDRLGNQAIQRIATLRGDKSLQDSETKRDAAITVYNRIAELKSKGQNALNPIDYAEALAQIYRAQAGTGATNEVMNAIRQDTLAGKGNQWYTKITGNQAPATTASITDSLQERAKSLGQQADKFHAGYMAPHLIKPTNLDQSTWDQIASTARGTSFADATKQAASQPSAPVAKQIGGQTYIQQNGKWYQQ